MYIETSTILMGSSLIVAFGVIFGTLFKARDWYVKQNLQDKEIEDIKDEQCVICYGLLACLDGLKQLGANGNVTEAHTKLEKHINKSAHR